MSASTPLLPAFTKSGTKEYTNLMLKKQHTLTNPGF